MIRIFIGYDEAEPAAYHVLCHSIMRHASEPVTIAPLKLSLLGRAFWRKRETDQSTDFSYTRYLIPYLCAYDGWAIFMDCDMLMRDDVAELWKLREERFAIQCVHHDHRPRETSKFLGRVQVPYERKNWSSVMLMNCARLRMLTPEFVNKGPGKTIRSLGFLQARAIGPLDPTWNHLVGYQEPDQSAKILHYTIGGPWFEAYRDTEFSNEWRAEAAMAGLT